MRLKRFLLFFFLLSSSSSSLFILCIRWWLGFFWLYKVLDLEGFYSGSEEEKEVLLSSRVLGFRRCKIGKSKESAALFVLFSFFLHGF